MHRCARTPNGPHSAWSGLCRRSCTNLRSQLPIAGRAREKFPTRCIFCVRTTALQDEQIPDDDSVGRPNPNGLEKLGEPVESHKAGYVTLIGRPNVGKSTLMNSLVGQKLSIVTRKAQTTRHRILGLVSGVGFQIILLDTPGVIWSMKTELDRKMMDSISQALDDADVLLALVDCAMQPKDDINMIQPPQNWQGPPMAVVLNKMDLIHPQQSAALKQWYTKNCRAEAIFLTNAKTGEGVEAVKQWALGKLPQGPPLYPKDTVSEQPERFFVSEIIREKIFLQYRQEIPYSVQVNVVEFKERPRAKDYLLTEILVERPLQRAILLGKNGTAIKQLATAARADIEDFLGRPVFLDIHVKVVKDWRKDDKLLERLGYGS